MEDWQVVYTVVHCILCTVHCTLCPVHCTVHCTLYCTLYTVQGVTLFTFILFSLALSEAAFFMLEIIGRETPLKK